jgi:hypothetical protein
MPGGRATIGGAIAFASGGKVPGRFVGRQDTVLARLTPGEYVIPRELTAALEQVLLGNRSPASIPVHATFRINDRVIAEATAHATHAEQARVIGYKSQRW